VVLEAFHLFAEHARQALLYCLLDTAQSCHSHSSGTYAASNRSTTCGIAVIGVTTRIDSLNLLEKRVKSRFSGRVIRVSPPNTLDQYLAVAKSVLEAPVMAKDYRNDDFDIDAALLEEWEMTWSSAVEVGLFLRFFDRRV
jgi:origin recognition complex subunit 4